MTNQEINGIFSSVETIYDMKDALDDILRQYLPADKYDEASDYLYGIKLACDNITEEVDPLAVFVLDPRNYVSNYLETQLTK